MLVLACMLFIFLQFVSGAQPTTKPAPTLTWHSKIVPWVHPQDKELSTEPEFDPAEYLSDKPRDDREYAFTFLITTRIFTGPVVGGGAATSEHSRVFHLLMSQPDAKEIFLDLFARGNDVAKLYALCALHDLDDAKVFRRRIEPFVNSKIKLQTHYGCLIFECDLGSVIPDIASGTMTRSLLRPHGKK